MKVIETLIKAENTFKATRFGFLLERNPDLYQAGVNTYNALYNKAFGGNRRILTVAVVSTIIFAIALVAAI
jgi:hypothetical protein